MEKKTNTEKTEGNGNCVYVGKKHIYRYVLACHKNLSEKGDTKIVARGRNISKAVDTAEIVKRNYANLSEEISIGSEQVNDEEKKKTLNISTIAINLSLSQNG